MRHCPLPSGDEVAHDLLLRVHLSGHSLCSRDRGWMAARFSIANVGRQALRGHQYTKEPKHSGRQPVARTPIQTPTLGPDVADTAPSDSVLTVYDEEHVITRAAFLSYLLVVLRHQANLARWPKRARPLPFACTEDVRAHSLRPLQAAHSSQHFRGSDPTVS